MTGWQYKVCKLTANPEYVDDTIISYGVFEVYYDENNDISHISQNPMVMSETIEGLKLILKKMIKCCDEPIIDYNDGEET
jgi:hypothetical protein